MAPTWAGPGLFILQYAKLVMLQLYYNFFKIFCDDTKFELIEMDTDSLYMAISETNIEEIIKPEMRLGGKTVGGPIVVKGNSKLMVDSIFSLETVAVSTTNLIKEHLVFSKKSFDVLKW